MKTQYLTLAAAACMACSAQVSAEDSGATTSDFVNTAVTAYETCVAFALVGAPTQRECIEKQKAGIEPKWLAAKKNASKDRPVTAMLRDFYAYYWAGMVSMVPQADETKPFYLARTGEVLRGLRERAMRIELEAGTK